MTNNIIKADVTIGVHPNNHSLFVLRRTGILENILKEHHATVAWVDYLEGAKTPQRIAAGEIDFGGTGSTPPLTAQATDIDIVYVAVSNPRPASGALVVRKESPVQSAAELKGSRIALTEGSWHTSFLATALDKEGLLYNDVVRVNLANEGGNSLLAEEVDAWIGNDPQLTELQNKGLVRTLVSLDSHISHRSVWFASRSFATSKPQILGAVAEALQKADIWIQENTREAAELFARDLPNWPSVDSWEAALRRRPWGLQPITKEFIAEQQRTADLLTRQNILPKNIVVSDAVLPDVVEIGGK
ncbi:aliphatic sulfonate ABC transporter substrate-binding protein [Bacillus salipaludis]|uniref:aliphatic sulfonate ABC transporter substrate-binding protein n=1 Tax=Bacillus salipaludis TaxID=2547811 RepID=UPI002E21A9BB|nr:aliphatic sulfonate ABC transporter substrate-binding protein [Bacillus salipaludis]